MCSIFRCVDADVNTPVSEWHFDEFLKHPAETTAALKTAVIKEEMKTFMLYCQAAKEATKMCDPASGIESYEPGRFCPLSDSLCPRLSLQPPPHKRLCKTSANFHVRPFDENQERQKPQPGKVHQKQHEQTAELTGCKKKTHLKRNQQQQQKKRLNGNI